MKNEKEIQERINAHYKKIEVFEKLIKKNGESLGLILAIEVQEAHILALEWVLNESKLEDKIIKKAIDNK
jgi:hypothetical protein